MERKIFKLKQSAIVYISQQPTSSQLLSNVGHLDDPVKYLESGRETTEGVSGGGRRGWGANREVKGGEWSLPSVPAFTGRSSSALKLMIQGEKQAERRPDELAPFCRPSSTTVRSSCRSSQSKRTACARVVRRQMCEHWDVFNIDETAGAVGLSHDASPYFWRSHSFWIKSAWKTQAVSTDELERSDLTPCQKLQFIKY